MKVYKYLKSICKMNARDFLDLQDAYQGVYDEIDEATAMAKRGYDETKLRQRAGGGEAADRATSLENQPTYGDANKANQRQNYARAQRGDFRKTASSKPGLHGYAHKSNDPAVKAKQVARGAQRGVLTPKEKEQLNMEMEYDTFDAILEHLVAEGYADTNENALAIMANMSEEWKEEILDEAYQEPRFGKKDYIRKLSKRGGMGMGTSEDPHGYRDPKMAKVGAEFSKRKTAAAKAKKTGEPDSYRAEKEAQSKRR
jgi:hypothetical protein